MFDLEQVIRGAIRRGCFCPSRCRGHWSMRLSSWPSMRRRTPTSSRGTWCSHPGRLATASSRPFSRRPSVGHPTSRPCPRRFGTIAASWALKSTGRWESPARTRRAMMPPSCATGNSSARRSPASSACTGTSACGRPGCGDVPADVAAGLDCTRPGDLRRGLDRRVSRDRPRELAIPAELSILCGLAVGYPDPDFPADKLTSAARPSRRTWCSSTADPGENSDRHSSSYGRRCITTMNSSYRPAQCDRKTRSFSGSDSSSSASRKWYFQTYSMRLRMASATSGGRVSLAATRRGSRRFSFGVLVSVSYVFLLVYDGLQSRFPAAATVLA